MDTSYILLWGLGLILVVVVLGILFSKQNDGKKISKSIKEPILKEKEKEMCSRCGRCEAIDSWNDAAVCEDCFDELDEEEDEDDWPKGETPEYYDEDSYMNGPGLSLFSLIRAMFVLGIILIVVITISGEVGNIFNGSNVTSFDGVTDPISFRPPFHIIVFVVIVASFLLGFIFKVFSFFKNDNFA